MEQVVQSASNDTASAEVSGNESLTYAAIIKKAAGISRTNNPVKLRDLRDDADAVIAELKEQISESEQNIANSADELDKLALKSEVVSLKVQVSKVAGLKDKISARVKELLKG